MCEKKALCEKANNLKITYVALLAMLQLAQLGSAWPSLTQLDPA